MGEGPRKRGAPPAGPVPADGTPAERAQYGAEDQQRIREQWVAGTPPQCPQCAVTMNNRTIGGGSFGLGYARRRVWLLCPQCRRSAIFDSARMTRN